MTTHHGPIHRVDPAREPDLEAQADLLERAAIRTGSHLWVVLARYRVEDPADGAQLLDAASLMGYPLVGCWVCELPYSQALAYRRCRGRAR